MIPRTLTHVQQGQIAHEPAWYLDADGRLEMGTLLRAFQTFWRKDGHLAAEGFRYREAGPHLGQTGGGARLLRADHQGRWRWYRDPPDPPDRRTHGVWPMNGLPVRGNQPQTVEARFGREVVEIKGLHG